MMDRSETLFDDGIAKMLGDPVHGFTGPAAYDPPAIDPSLVTLANRLSLRRMPVAAALGDAAIAFAPIGLLAPNAMAPAKECVVFRLRIDGRPLTLKMANGLFERILDRIDPALRTAERDHEILPLLLESCLEDGLLAAEALLQRRIELVAIEPGAAIDLDGLDMALEISIDGEKAGVAALRAPKEDVERLADLLQTRAKPPRSYGDLDVELRFRAGAIWLDHGELERLKIGDVLLVEEDSARWQRMAATVGETWLFPIDVTRTGPTVRAAFRKADFRDQEEWMMVEHSQTKYDKAALSGLLKNKPRPEADGGESRAEAQPGADVPAGEPDARPNEETEIDAGPTAPPADAAFDELPIKLLFELGRLDIALGELQDIGPGHVFQLDRPLGEAVEIQAGGRRIGQGEIIKIDDQIGVRVVRLFGQSGA